jgi:crotonobetainyl-CoA:carnitine CoA-transferase CaiB-like acyl-CoA transferase
VRALGNPVKMSKSPPQLRTVAPALGADTDAILADLGYTGDEVAALRRKHVL